MRWTILLLLIGLCAGEAHAQANPAVRPPLICRTGTDTGPGGKCVPLNLDNPEDRKLLEKIIQTPPDIRSAPPVLPPTPPDPVISIGTTIVQTPSLVIVPYQPLVPIPQAETAPEPYCDLACSQAKLHQFDTLPSQPGQAPSGAGALWGVTQALSERQQRSRQVRSQQQDTQLQDALRTEAFTTDMLALRIDISFVRANSQPKLSPGMPLQMGMRPEDIQIFEDQLCLGHKNGDRVENIFDRTLWVCYESVTDGDMHATEPNLPGGGAADLRRWTKGFTDEQTQELRKRVCERSHSNYIDNLICYRN
jgi:hypothetical protein